MRKGEGSGGGESAFVFFGLSSFSAGVFILTPFVILFECKKLKGQKRKKKKKERNLEKGKSWMVVKAVEMYQGNVVKFFFPFFSFLFFFLFCPFWLVKK